MNLVETYAEHRPLAQFWQPGVPMRRRWLARMRIKIQRWLRG